MSTAPASPNGQTPEPAPLAPPPDPVLSSAEGPVLGNSNGADRHRLSPLRRSVRLRLPQVRSLALRGHTRAEIAAALGVSERTISADFQRLAQLQQQDFDRRVGPDGRLHALDVHRLVQASAWRAVDAILGPESLGRESGAFRNLAPLLRVVARSQDTIDVVHATQREDRAAAERTRRREQTRLARQRTFEQEERRARATSPSPIPQ